MKEARRENGRENRRSIVALPSASTIGNGIGSRRKNAKLDLHASAAVPRLTGGDLGIFVCALVLFTVIHGMVKTHD